MSWVIKWSMSPTKQSVEIDKWTRSHRHRPQHDERDLIENERKKMLANRDQNQCVGMTKKSNRDSGRVQYDDHDTHRKNPTFRSVDNVLYRSTAIRSLFTQIFEEKVGWNAQPKVDTRNDAAMKEIRYTPRERVRLIR